MDLYTEDLCRVGIQEKENERSELLNADPTNVDHALSMAKKIAKLDKEIRGLKEALAKFGG